MEANWSKLQTQFHTEGYCEFKNFFPPELLNDWRDTVKMLVDCPDLKGVNHINKTFEKADVNARDGAGSYKFISIDGRVSLSPYFKDLAGYYKSISNFLSIFTGLDIVPSWDEKSSVTFMFYPAPGGTLLPHFDTNQPTFLLYLSDNKNEGGTKLYPLSTLRPTILGHPDELIGEPIVVYPEFGKILLFNGRKVWHESQPVQNNDKISVVFNFYEKNDQWRPKEISERLYK